MNQEKIWEVVEPLLNSQFRTIELDKQVNNELPLLYSSSIKTYMDYKAITSKRSTQWDMLYNQQLFKITVDGYLMTDDGYYAVALGSYFGSLGSKYIFVLEDGKEIPVCKLDAKADIHTDINNYAALDGSIVEFIVDTSKMDYAMKANGYIYNGNFNNCPRWKGKITQIIIIE